MLLRFSITKILVSCIFAGLIMTSCSIQGRSVDEYRDFDPAGITAISVEGVSLDVSLSVVPGDKIKTRLTGTTTANQVLFDTELDNGTLRIICDENTILSSNLNLAIEIPDGDLCAVDIKTVSGDIHISDTGSDAGTTVITLMTTSGNITADRIEGKTEAMSVSGKMSIEYKNTAYETLAESVSGNIKIQIPDGSSFSFNTETVSGRRECEFPHSGNMNSGNTGSGGPRLSLKTISGSIEINKV